MKRSKKLASGYRSKFEERTAAQLKKEKIKFLYEVSAFIYYLKVSGTCNICGGTDVQAAHLYTPDFKMSNLWIETKGKFTSKDRTKMIAVKEQHTKLDVRLLFMANNKLFPKSKTRYLDWAEQHGYKAAVGVIPKEWIKELKSR